MANLAIALEAEEALFRGCEYPDYVPGEIYDEAYAILGWDYEPEEPEEYRIERLLIDGLCYDCRKDFQEQMTRIDKENEKQCL